MWHQNNGNPVATCAAPPRPIKEKKRKELKNVCLRTMRVVIVQVRRMWVLECAFTIGPLEANLDASFTSQGKGRPNLLCKP